jgi:hypothetical protein
VWADYSGNPLTNAAKITERFRRPTFGSMEIEIAVDDSKAYTKPWTVKLTSPSSSTRTCLSTWAWKARRTHRTW